MTQTSFDPFPAADLETNRSGRPADDQRGRLRIDARAIRKNEFVGAAVCVVLAALLLTATGPAPNESIRPIAGVGFALLAIFFLFRATATGYLLTQDLRGGALRPWKGSHPTRLRPLQRPQWPRSGCAWPGNRRRPGSRRGERDRRAAGRSRTARPCRPPCQQRRRDHDPTGAQAILRPEGQALPGGRGPGVRSRHLRPGSSAERDGGRSTANCTSPSRAPCRASSAMLGTGRRPSAAAAGQG
jgi:hypothetical protein